MFRPSAQLLNVKNEDPVIISLGYDTDLTAVFSGMVDVVEVGISHLRLLGLGPAVKLLKLRLNQTYLNQSAGAIVRDLCTKAQVSAGNVQDGITIPSFCVTHEVSSYEYVRELAERSGFDVYFTPENKLDFKPYKPREVHDLEYGFNVLSVESVEVMPPDGVRVFGESPSSAKGSDTSHWLTKDDIEGTAGTGQALLLFDPAVRDKATADAVAKSRLAHARNTFQVSLTTLGNPEVKLGDAASLKGFDPPHLEGEFKVRTVEHSLNKRSGFTTLVVCSKEM